MIQCLLFLLGTWMKQKKRIFFFEYEHKIKINIFSHDKLKFNLEPRT